MHASLAVTPEGLPLGLTAATDEPDNRFLECALAARDQDAGRRGGEHRDVEGLVDRSLVVVREQSSATRFDLLETVTQR